MRCEALLATDRGDLCPLDRAIPAIPSLQCWNRPGEMDPTNFEKGGDLLDGLNPDSLKVPAGCKIEPDCTSVTPGERFQLERKGYFCMDPDSSPEKPVFHRTVTLRDTGVNLNQKN